MPSAPTLEKPLSKGEEAVLKENTKITPTPAEKMASSEDEIDDVEPGEAMIIDEPNASSSSKVADQANVEITDSAHSNPSSNTTSRLLAAGVSVSVISRKKSIEATNKKDRPSDQSNESHLESKKISSSKSLTPSTATTANESVKKIGLGSDISVTVVQKKKSIDGGKIRFYCSNIS